MVKIIKYGTRRRIECRTCGSLLEYEKEDVETVQAGMNEYTQKIVCPNCREEIAIMAYR